MSRVSAYSRTLIARRRRIVLWGAIVFGISVGVFLPIARHGFIQWDDQAYFVQNAEIRGWQWSNIVWFFTTTYMGHYQPLNWMSYALDYSISGLNPGRFHLTQAILHGIVASLFFVVARNLLRRCVPDEPSGVLTLSAAIAALLFSVHPLRVESVAWASARADLLASAFFLLALYAYIRAVEHSKGRAVRWNSLAPTFFLFAAALLSKEMAVTLPAILLLLDIFPFRRLPLSPRGWADPEPRRVLLEKMPFFVLSAAATINAFYAADQGVADLKTHPLGERFAQLFVSLAFYPFKTIAPTALSPFYDYPPHFGWGHPRVWMSVAAVGMVTTILWCNRRRAPALIAAATAYVVLILPVSGLTQRGAQLTADRYSYLSCLPWALIGGMLIASAWRRRPRMAAIAILILLAFLIHQTEKQINLWADSVTLWQHAVALEPYNSPGYFNLGQALETAGHHDDAIEAYKKALALRPHHPDAQRNLAAIYNRLFRNREAIEAYLADLADNPNRLESQFYLAATYERIGDDENAQKHYREALRIDPKYIDAHVALGRLFLKHGYLAEAEARLRHALDVNPGHIEAMQLLARCCAETNRGVEADQLMDRAIREARRRGDEKGVAELRRTRQQLKAVPASRPATSR